MLKMDECSNHYILWKPNSLYVVISILITLRIIIKKKQLSSLLNTYNLFSTVSFPTRITNTSKLAIDNIFIEYSIMMGK
jgi:hypothetical protein